MKKMKQRGVGTNRWTKAPRAAREDHGNNNNAPVYANPPFHGMYPDPMYIPTYMPMTTSTSNSISYNANAMPFGVYPDCMPIRSYAEMGSAPANSTNFVTGNEFTMDVNTLVNQIAMGDPYRTKEQIREDLVNKFSTGQPVRLEMSYIPGLDNFEPLGVRYLDEIKEQTPLEKRPGIFGKGFLKPMRVHPDVAKFMCLDLFDVKVSSVAHISKFCALYVGMCYPDAGKFSLRPELRKLFSYALTHFEGRTNPDEMSGTQLMHVCLKMQRDFDGDQYVVVNDVDLDFNEQLSDGFDSQMKVIISTAWRARGYHPNSEGGVMDTEKVEVWVTRTSMVVEKVSRVRVSCVREEVSVIVKKLPLFECCACMEEKAAHHFGRLNCGHKVTCVDCVWIIKGANKPCPMCRAPIHKVARVSLAEALVIVDL